MDKQQNIEEVFQHLRRIVKALELFSKEVDAQFGLTAPQLWALWELGKEGPLSLKDLAARLHVHPSTMVGVVDRLEAKGLATRKPDATDRRRIRLALTPAGRALRKKAPHPAQGRLRTALEEMPERQIQDLHRMLGTIVKAMEAEGVETTFFFSGD